MDKQTEASYSSQSKPIPLDALFSYPYVWQPTRTISFLRVAHNFLEGKAQIHNENIEETKKEIVELRKSLDANSHVVWADNGNWTNVIGRKHSDILTGQRRRFFDRIKLLRKKEVNSSSVVDLVGIVRNKYDHSEEFSPSERNELGWWLGDSEQVHDVLFVSYWTQKFPNLLPYLWMKFYRYKSNSALRDFYPYPVDTERLVDLVGFSQQIHIALHNKLNGASGTRRNSEPEIAGKSGSLKVKILPADLLKKTLMTGGCSVGIKLLPGKLTFLWQQCNRKQVEMISYNMPANNNMYMEPTALIVLHGGNELGKLMLEAEVLESISRVIIFGDKARLKDKMSKIDSLAKPISTLNTLEIEKPVENTVPVENPVDYLLLDWKNMSSRCLEIFEIESKFMIQGKIVSLKDILPENGNIRTKLLSQLTGNMLYDLLRQQRPVLLEKHKLPTVSNGYLERKVYHRSVRQLKMGEDEMLENLEGARKVEQIIFIAQKAGSGKSQFLRNIARKIVQKFRQRIVLVFNMKEFVEHLKLKCTNSSKLKTSDIISTITNLCCDGSNFEQNLIAYWLEEQNSCKVTFDLMFDGIDEVQSKALDWAMETIRIVGTKIPAVRVWATLQSHTLNEMHINFDCSIYKLEEFSEEEQVDYVEEIWSAYLEKNEKKERFEILRQFARQCLSQSISDSNFVGIPLQCRLIAEIYKRKVLNRDFTLDIHSRDYSGNDMDDNWDNNFGTLVGKLFKKLTGENNETRRVVDLEKIWIGTKAIGPLMHLYETLIERKFEIFVREKKEIPESIKMDHSIVKSMRDKMDRFHIYFALKLLFPAEVAEEFRARLLKTAASKMQVNSDVLEYGIIESITPLIFIHRTFAEYFIALFIYKISNDQFWYAQKVDTAFKRFHQHWLRAATDYSRQSQVNSRQKPQFPLFCHLLRTMCKNRREFKLLLLQLHHYY